MGRCNKFGNSTNLVLSKLLRVKNFLESNIDNSYSMSKIANECMLGKETCKSMIQTLITLGLMTTTQQGSHMTHYKYKQKWDFKQ